jgi:hypothetical protein
MRIISPAMALSLAWGVLAQGEAHAQALPPLPPPPPPPHALPGADGEAGALAAQIDADFQSLQVAAQAQGGNCATACRALESMRRATERLCTIEPGDRCADALRKVGDATQRVRAACPACPESLTASPATRGEAGKAPQTIPAAEQPPMSANSPVAREVVAEETRKRGGCAGCATAPAHGGAVSPYLLAAAILLARRRRVVG